MRPLSFGSWPSKISSATLSSANRAVNYPQICNDTLFWQEAVTDERRTTIRSLTPEGVANILKPPYGVGTKANIYGGQCWTPTPHGLVFVNKSDQKIYLATHQRTINISPKVAAYYADFHYCAALNSVFFVGEHHREAEHPLATIESIHLLTGEHQILHRTEDFCAAPTVSETGEQIAWMSWSKEVMNWDASTISLAALQNGCLNQLSSLETDPCDGVFQPCFYDQDLWYCSDRSGWSKLYRYAITNGSQALMVDLDRDIGRPLWLYGWSSYCFNSNRVYSVSTREGLTQLWCSSLQGEILEQIELPYSQLEALQSYQDGVVFIASNWCELPTLCAWSPSKGLVVLRSSALEPAETEWISKPEHLRFPTSGESEAYGYFYPPKHPHYHGPEHSLPPLIVMAHGGPTAANTDALNYKVQFWTSRGYAVMDVNYRGSIGYGRHYRESLNGHWGCRDADDVIAAANYLIQTKRVNAKQVAIKGSSAGAYTLLQALRRPSPFQAAACHYGIGDLFALEAETHKFEAGYNRILIGPLPAAEALYQARSPLFHAEQINCPIIFFQGLEDEVVKPEQTQLMCAALAKRSVPYAALYFEGEGHGFRDTDTIDQVLKAEHWFYSQRFGFNIDTNDLPKIGNAQDEVSIQHG
ncbi:alpha/beta hydrolase family protein [Umboniibacter marinipuniceus]|uniref:Prolyl oligopeptidase family protein n=1 Tax=Umboniibacter marinipuniceus TaxID=569599 RepID=A0A3M0A9A7_9GAMM|nr:prolyl oligopeptidase family serine peptidase [Umboniibacter marinipuniceus]RMA79408.1 prolyl oligopeptidase family protein [Umboniibacter marinipuniceus]